MASSPVNAYRQVMSMSCKALSHAPPTARGCQWRWSSRTTYAREHPRLQMLGPHGRRSRAWCRRLLWLLQAAVLRDGGAHVFRVELVLAGGIASAC
jgi:hypothetical protein